MTDLVKVLRGRENIYDDFSPEDGDSTFLWNTDIYLWV
jgi:hypothetical protein